MSEKFSDWRWRLRNLYRIKTKSAETRTFRPNNIQELIMAEDPSRLVVLKARQVGISTYCLLKLLDRTIGNRNQTTCILSHEQDSIEKLFRIIRFAYDQMPYLKPKVDKGGGSKYALFFPDINSRIYVDLESRSDTIHNLHVSEMAFVEDPDRVSATLDAVPATTGYVSIETTPNGLNHFYDFWNGEIPFKKFFFPWYLFPEYQLEAHSLTELTKEELELKEKAKKLYGIDLTMNQIAFRRFKIQEKGGTRSAHRMFLQEYPEDDSSCFLTSGNSAFDNILLGQLKQECLKPISDDGNVRIFKPYDKTQMYACGVDTSEGTGADYSYAIVYNAYTREQVACLHGKFRPDLLADEVNRLCALYQSGERPWPLLGVEKNNHGHSVLLELSKHIGYPNLYSHDQDKLGWLTDKVSRPLMLDAFIEGVEHRSCRINDIDLLNECLTFVEKDKKMQAESGKHDDRVMAAAIGLQMCLEVGPREMYQDFGRMIRI